MDSVCIEANAQALARYAALCQEAGLVPVVEPEVLMAGEHTLERCFEVTEEVLRTVFNHLYTQRVTLEGMILKPNMVLPGLTCSKQETVDAVADATVRCLLRTVPAAVPGIAFLSGGQSGELASARLNAMNVRFKSRLPWAIGVFVCPRHPATGFGALARRRGPRVGGTARPCIIALDSTGLPAVENTLPRWKKRCARPRISRNSHKRRHSPNRKIPHDDENRCRTAQGARSRSRDPNPMRRTI